MTGLLSIEGLWVDGAVAGGRWAPIVKGVDVALARGQVMALIGESGAGKSTVALAALGYVRSGCRIRKGRVLFDGSDILASDTAARRQLRGRRIAYVAQSAAAAFNPALRIDEQVAEGPAVHGMAPSQTGNHADLYGRLHLPNPATIGRRYPHQVSGGQLQRLMIAMAMSCDPDLLILDEPTTALDVTTQVEVLLAIKSVISARGTAAIYVSHDLAVVAQIADRITVLRRGERVEEGSTDDILNRPRAAYTQQLMDVAHPPARPRRSGVTSGTAVPALEATGIDAGYGIGGRIRVLQDISMTLPRARIVAVVGESGSGKSTLARVLAGLLAPRSGSIRLNGKPLGGSFRLRTREELRRIQIVFQSADVSLNPRQTIGEILGRPARLYHRAHARTRNRRVVELLRLVELPEDFVCRRPSELSGGQRQRIGIARALAAAPDVMLCDEITASLDKVVGVAVIDLLLQLQQQLGLALLYISHDIALVSTIADEIYVLYGGRVVERGPAARVLAPPFHPYTRLLLSAVRQLRRGWLEEFAATRDMVDTGQRSVFTAPGCSFEPRCGCAVPGKCDRVRPPIRRLGNGHEIACHREIADLEEIAVAAPLRRCGGASALEVL